MQWIRPMGQPMVWWRQRTPVWGALLGQQDILLAALSVQATGVIRVAVFEHLHAPAGLVHLSERDDDLAQNLKTLGKSLPRSWRTMALAVCQTRCRQGLLAWSGGTDLRKLAAEVQLEAATALGVGPAEVGFDFSVNHPPSSDMVQVQWVACLRAQLLQWQRHARLAGWRLPVVEPEWQAAQRALRCWHGDMEQLGVQSPRDWQFELQIQRESEQTGMDWSLLHGGPMWKPLVACGAALGVLQ